MKKQERVCISLSESKNGECGGKDLLLECQLVNVSRAHMAQKVGGQ